MARTNITALLFAALIAACYAQSGFTFSGYEYKCEGDESCAFKTDSQIIESLICKGFCSCCGSEFTFPCGKDKCSIECEEEDSCTGMSIVMDLVEEVSCGEPRACAGSDFLLGATKGFKMECSDEEACAYASIAVEMQSTETDAHMDEFQCDGEGTCAFASVVVERLEKLSCEGYRSCGDASIGVYNPAKDFSMQCEGNSACADAEFYFGFSEDAPDLHMKSIECESSQACEFATIIIENSSSGTVVIDELKCEGFQGCSYLTFQTTGNVQINKCICEQPSEYTCLCTSGLDDICSTFEGSWTSSSSVYTCSNS